MSLCENTIIYYVLATFKRLRPVRFPSCKGSSDALRSQCALCRTFGDFWDPPVLPKVAQGGPEGSETTPEDDQNPLKNAPRRL